MPGPVYDAGKYVFRVTNQGFGKSVKKHTPYFFLEGELVAMLGPNDEKYACPEGKRTISLYLTEGTIEARIADLQKIGWTGRKFATLDPSIPGFHSFIGNEIVAECKHSPGRDDASKLFEEWQLPFGQREAAKSDAAVSKKLDMLFGKKLSSAAQAKPAAQPRQSLASAVQELEGEKDTIPF